MLAKPVRRGPNMLQRHACPAVLAEITEFNELTPGDNIGTRWLNPNDGWILRAIAPIAVEPAEHSLTPETKQRRRLAHAIDRPIKNGD